MKVAEFKKERKVWEIEVHTNKMGNKFVKAKCMTQYDTLLEVQLYKMHDNVVIAYEVNHNLVDNETLSELRKVMMEIREQYCSRPSERRY